MASVGQQAIASLALDAAFLAYTSRPITSLSIVAWFGPFFFLVFGINAIYALFIYPNYVTPYRNMPGSDRQSVLLGNFVDFGNHYYDHAIDLGKKYPDAHFTRFHGPLGMDYIIAESVEAHFQILQTHVYKFVKPLTVSRGFKEVIGNGIFFSEGEAHKVQRRILTPALTYGHVRLFVPIFMDKTSQIINIINDYLQGGTKSIKLLPILERLTLDVIGEATFGIDMKAISDEDNELVKSYRFLSTPVDYPFFFFMNSHVPGFKYLPLPYNNNMRRAKSTFEKTCRNVLKTKMENLTEKRTDGKERDLVSILLRDSSHQWTMEEIEGQIMTFLLAGHETTAGAVSWALLSLAKNQDVQDKLRAEVRQSFPAGLQSITTAEQIEALKYLNNVVRECFRLNPPVPHTVRDAAQDVEIAGQFIKKGTTVQISIKHLNTLPQLWGTDSFEFVPDRWNDRVADHAYGYSTFLQGARSCMGKKLAEIEFKCILASLVGKYRFEKSSPDQPDPLGNFVITIKPIDSMLLNVTAVPGW
ncbi:cytochrome P450 [Lipomyces japonicus]|uniref:cytochrome P450 n=1 Tax=Lipomyces japonicus TaxID=56871 RepID=UPI0034CF58B5